MARKPRVGFSAQAFLTQPGPGITFTNVNQAMLADMIGSTRPRVNYFMNKFRKLGFLDYNGTLRVHSSLLNIVLHD